MLTRPRWPTRRWPTSSTGTGRRHARSYARCSRSPRPVRRPGTLLPVRSRRVPRTDAGAPIGPKPRPTGSSPGCARSRRPQRHLARHRGAAHLPSADVFMKSRWCSPKPPPGVPVLNALLKRLGEVESGLRLDERCRVLTTSDAVATRSTTDVRSGRRRRRAARTRSATTPGHARRPRGARLAGDPQRRPRLRCGPDARVRSWTERRLGEPSAARDVYGGRHGDTMVLGRTTRAPAEQSVLLAHYDTVWSLGTLAEWPFTSTATAPPGPGVFDMKSGLVHAVWAVRALRAAGVPRPAIRLVLNGDEELGSPASRPMIEARCRGHHGDAGLRGQRRRRRQDRPQRRGPVRRPRQAWKPTRAWTRLKGASAVDAPSPISDHGLTR